MLNTPLDKEVLEAYLTTREQVDKEVQQMQTLTSLLKQYKDCSGDEVHVEMTAIGEINYQLHNQLHNITEALDDFLPVWEAVNSLNKE